MRLRRGKSMEQMKRVIGLWLLSAVLLLSLNGCVTTIIKGDFCDLYQPTNKLEADGYPNDNEAVYQCICLDSDAEWCD